MEPTSSPIVLAYDIPADINAVCSQGSSSHGFSTVSSFLECPEKGRLRSVGVQPNYPPYDGEKPLEARDFGSLMHVLAAVRVVVGQVWAEALLGEGAPVNPTWPAPYAVPEEQRVQALTLLREYDDAYPIEHVDGFGLGIVGATEDAYEYLGVEVNVVSEITALGVTVFRTARYDAVIRDKYSGLLFSLEHKTSKADSRFGKYQYEMQAKWQQTLWNANPYLVATYGRMDGVIFDWLFKKKTPPLVRRDDPWCFSDEDEEKTKEYMVQPELLTQLRTPDAAGRFPRFHHSCRGKFGGSSCPYYAICWYGADGGYTESEE